MTRILIVEDEQVVAWHIREALEKLGYEVVASVASGTRAIEQAETERPDLVLMDIRLKGKIDGVTAAEQIYTRFDIPIIYLTAHTDENTLQRATRTAPFGYLVKPLRAQELKTTIEVTLHRHQLERAARQTQQQLSTTLTSIGDATIATDLHGTITFMNPAAEELTGWHAADALGQSISDVLILIQEDSREVIENPLLQAIAQGTTVKLGDRVLLRTKDGQEKAVGDSAAPIRNADGVIVGGVVIFHDLTERRQAEIAAQQTQAALIGTLKTRTEELQGMLSCTQLLRRFVEQTQNTTETTQILHTLVQQVGESFHADYCWISLHDAAISSATLSYEFIRPGFQLPGAPPPASAIGAQITLSAFPRFYFSIFQRELWLNPDQDVLPLPYQQLRPPASQLLILPFFDDQRVLGEVGMLRGAATGWNKPHAELLTQVLNQCAIVLRQTQVSHKAQTQAYDSDLLSYLKEDFLSSVSSELRTPLTNMRMAVEMLRRTTQALKLAAQSPEGAQTREVLLQKLEDYVQVVQEEWQKEFTLINDLLSFHELEPGELWTFSCVDLQRWLPQTLSPFMLQAAQNRQELSFEVSPYLTDVLIHQPTLKRIVSELLRNACKFTPSHQQIRVVVEPAGQWWQLRVTNTGVEISPEECDRAFEPFYRGAHTERWRHNGLGLGLALVKRLALRLSGDITVKSGNHQTTFTLTLPLSQ